MDFANGFSTHAERLSSEYSIQFARYIRNNKERRDSVNEITDSQF